MCQCHQKDHVRSRLLNSLFGNFDPHQSSNAHQPCHQCRCRVERDDYGAPQVHITELFQPLPNALMSVENNNQFRQRPRRLNHNGKYHRRVPTVEDPVTEDYDENLDAPKANGSNHTAITRASSTGSSSSESSSSTLKSKVSFHGQVSVVEIPSHRDYGEETKRRIWNSLDVIKQNRIRNTLEFYVDGGDWRNATEEENFAVMPVTGELVHPATWLREAPLRVPPPPPGHRSSFSLPTASSQYLFTRNHRRAHSAEPASAPSAASSSRSNLNASQRRSRSQYYDDAHYMAEF